MSFPFGYLTQFRDAYRTFKGYLYWPPVLGVMHEEDFRRTMQITSFSYYPSHD